MGQWCPIFKVSSQYLKIERSINTIIFVFSLDGRKKEYLATWGLCSHEARTRPSPHLAGAQAVGHIPGGGIAGSMVCVFNLLTYAPRPSKEAGPGDTPASRRTEFQPLHPLRGTCLLAIICFNPLMSLAAAVPDLTKQTRTTR